MKYRLAALGLIAAISFSMLIGCSNGEKKPESETKTEQSVETQAAETQTAETQIAATQSAETQITETQVVINDDGEIGIEEAKAIALKDVGLENSEVVFIKEKREREGRSYEYEIEFVTDTTKYEYEIKAEDGAILQASQEPVERLSANAKTDGIIDVDEAKRIVLEDSKFTAEQVAYTSVELGYDDGHTEYEIDFFAEGMEYSYTLDAASGNILEKEVERP